MGITLINELFWRLFQIHQLFFSTWKNIVRINKSTHLQTSVNVLHMFSSGHWAQNSPHQVVSTKDEGGHVHRPQITDTSPSPNAVGPLVLELLRKLFSHSNEWELWKTARGKIYPQSVLEHVSGHLESICGTLLGSFFFLNLALRWWTCFVKCCEHAYLGPMSI